MLWFTSSKARKHGSNAKKIRFLEWPSNSPDLNPMKSVWRFMVQKIYTKNANIRIFRSFRKQLSPLGTKPTRNSSTIFTQAFIREFIKWFDTSEDQLIMKYDFFRLFVIFFCFNKIYLIDSIVGIYHWSCSNRHNFFSKKYSDCYRETYDASRGGSDVVITSFKP